MSRTALPRLVAAVFLMVAIVVAIIELGREGEEARRSPPTDAVTPSSLQSELQRCQTLGEAAVHDDGCLDVWAENRRRFLTSGSASERSE